MEAWSSSEPLLLKHKYWGDQRLSARCGRVAAALHSKDRMDGEAQGRQASGHEPPGVRGTAVMALEITI